MNELLQSKHRKISFSEFGRLIRCDRQSSHENGRSYHAVAPLFISDDIAIPALQVTAQIFCSKRDVDRTLQLHREFPGAYDALAEDLNAVIFSVTDFIVVTKWHQFGAVAVASGMIYTNFSLEWDDQMEKCRLEWVVKTVANLPVSDRDAAQLQVKQGGSSNFDDVNDLTFSVALFAHLNDGVKLTLPTTVDVINTMFIGSSPICAHPLAGTLQLIEEKCSPFMTPDELLGLFNFNL